MTLIETNFKRFKKRGGKEEKDSIDKAREQTSQGGREQSPARKSSLSRLTSSVLEKVLGSSNVKKTAGDGSDRGSNSGAPVNVTDTEGNKPATNRGSFFGGS